LAVSRPSLRNFLFALAATALALVVLEGVAALGLALADRNNPLRHPLAERRHTAYDPELGWVGVPSLRLTDLYGPGRTLTTNAQGFRGERDTPRRVPPGKVRLVCSGDSFTLGWGVDDDATWCAQLERLDPRIETVNLGQGGYGVDQAYLWAKRELPDLDFQVHVLAFISEDIHRMRYDRFRGYAKPMLAIADGVPVAVGTPVPPPARLTRPLDRLHLVRAIRRLLRREAPGAPPRIPLSEAAALAERAIEALNRDADARERRFVAVWLPTLPDYVSRGSDALRTTLIANLRAHDVLVIDLVEDLRRLTGEQADALFLRPDEVAYPAAGRHYSEDGNAFVAAAIWQRLRNLPELASPSADRP